MNNNMIFLLICAFQSKIVNKSITKQSVMKIYK